MSDHTVTSETTTQSFSSRLPVLANKYGLLVAWVAIIAVFGVLRPDTFFTAANFQTMFSTQAVLLVVALGLLPALVAGEYDLSVGGVMGVSLVLVGYLNVSHEWPVGAAVLVALGAGVLCGIVNAFFIVGLGIDSIVVTLGMGTFLAGVALGINNLPIGGVSESLVNAMRHEVFGLQMVFVYGLALTFIMWYVFGYTPLGRYLDFIGASRDVARLAGIRVDAIRVGALIASSVIAAIAGVMEAGILSGSDPTVGPTFLLPALAGVFLGATAITPGRFNAWGTFIAVYFLATGIVGLQLLGFSGWIEQVFYGLSLVLAVGVGRLASLSAARSHRTRKQNEEVPA